VEYDLSYKKVEEQGVWEMRVVIRERCKPSR